MGRRVLHKRAVFIPAQVHAVTDMPNTNIIFQRFNLELKQLWPILPSVVGITVKTNAK